MTNVMKFKRRRGSTGAAMVEGGILAPIFAMMMMMTVYLGGVYQVKYRSFMDGRFKAWSYASNNCEAGDGDKSETAQSGYQTPSQSNQGDGAKAQGRAEAEASSFIGHGYAEYKWDYSPTYRFNNNGPKTIRTDAWVVCNDKKHGMNVFSYLGGIVSQAFSGINLPFP